MISFYFWWKREEEKEQFSEGDLHLQGQQGGYRQLRNAMSANMGVVAADDWVVP